MKTEVLAKIIGVLTVILLAVSLTFLVYQWYLINGLSVTVFVFPITIIKVNLLGVVFFEQPLYVTNFTTKFILDLLFLVPYTLAILVTGLIYVFISPFSGIAGYEKFGDVMNKIRFMITKNTGKQRTLIISGILIIIVFYAVAVVPFVASSKTILNFPLIILELFIDGVLGLTIAWMRLQKIRKTIQ
ncbi:MAG: hypothetical protein WED07_05735 [Candidatus Freyarchaeum deiterrae]